MTSAVHQGLWVLKRGQELGQDKAVCGVEVLAGIWVVTHNHSWDIMIDWMIICYLDNINRLVANKKDIFLLEWFEWSPIVCNTRMG